MLLKLLLCKISVIYAMPYCHKDTDHSELQKKSQIF